MATKAVKGVSEEAWAAFKTAAAHDGVSMGRYLNELAEDVKRKEGASQWERILASRITHSGKEWKAIERESRHFRKNFSFRTFT